MHTIKLVGILWGWGAWLVSCSFAPSGSPKYPRPVSPSEVRQVLIFQEPTPPPSWFVNKTAPASDSAHLYFLGFSQKHSQESEARQAAQAEAIQQFLAYTGVTARNFVAYVSQSQSSAGGVISSETQGVETTTQMAEALLSRIQTVGRYVEKYSMQQGGVALGYRYRAAVLVKVPKEEYESVQKWKGAQARQRKEAVLTLIQSARPLALAGQVRVALQSLQRARGLVEATPPPDAAILLTQIEQAEQTIAGQVRVELLTPAGFQTRLATLPDPIEARIRFSDAGKTVSLAGFPMELKTDQHHLLQSSSDSAGRVQFFLPRMEQLGAVRLRIAPAPALRENISPEAFQTLRTQTDQLHFEVIQEKPHSEME